MKIVTQVYEVYINYNNDIRGELLHRILYTARREPTINEIACHSIQRSNAVAGYVYYRLYPKAVK